MSLPNSGVGVLQELPEIGGIISFTPAIEKCLVIFLVTLLPLTAKIVRIWGRSSLNRRSGQRRQSPVLIRNSQTHMPHPVALLIPISVKVICDRRAGWRGSFSLTGPSQGRAWHLILGFWAPRASATQCPD